jgi:hypothetical protein
VLVCAAGDSGAIAASAAICHHRAARAGKDDARDAASGRRQRAAAFRPAQETGASGIGLQKAVIESDGRGTARFRSPRRACRRIRRGRWQKGARRRGPVNRLARGGSQFVRPTHRRPTRQWTLRRTISGHAAARAVRGLRAASLSRTLAPSVPEAPLERDRASSAHVIARPFARAIVRAPWQGVPRVAFDAAAPSPPLWQLSHAAQSAAPKTSVITRRSRTP